MTMPLDGRGCGNQLLAVWRGAGRAWVWIMHSVCNRDFPRSNRGASLSAQAEEPTMTTTDYQMRNPETGRFESTPQREIVNDYLEEYHGVSLDELLAAYRQVNDTFRGRVCFPSA